MSIVRNSVWSAGSALILGIGRVALNAIVAHKMPQDVFGAFSYGQWLIELSVLVGLLGATNAGSRFIAEYSDQVGKQYSFYKAWSYCSYFLPPLVGAVLFLLAQILGGYEINNSLIFLAAWGVVASGATIDAANPPASMFRIAAGEWGFRFFGLLNFGARDLSKY